VKRVRARINSETSVSENQILLSNENNFCILSTIVDIPMINIPSNARWKQQGTTIAGVHGYGNALDQLAFPRGLTVDEHGTLFVADYENNRIMSWKMGSTMGSVVAGGHGRGNGLHQLNIPTHVIIDKDSDSIIISDYGNSRVVRWPRQQGRTGEVMIENISCRALAMDKNGSLYVSNDDKHEVRRYEKKDTTGTIVAGGNGWGNALNQLDAPCFLFVDAEQSVYVSDWRNHRVTKWKKGAKVGVLVAGEHEVDEEIMKPPYREGLWVDASGAIYLAEGTTNQVTRSRPGEASISVLVGGNGTGTNANQLKDPSGIFFDSHGNLYVADGTNHRVQRFDIEKH
jgi:sugar lactone lactonase YvrE